MKRLVLSIFALGALASCKTYSHSSRDVGLESKNVQSNTFVVDVEPNFSKRIKGSSNKKHKVEKSAKDEAYFNAILDNNVDIIVDPIYSITTTKKVFFIFGGKSEATVYGYAGFYKNPKIATQATQDVLIQKMQDLDKLSKINGVLEETEEKTFSVKSKCADCKDKEPITLMSIIKNKTSLLDAYKKLNK
jgi:hypothetical protein